MERMIWRTRKLRWPFLSVLLLAEIGIMVALAFLSHVSHNNQGFTTVNQGLSYGISVNPLNFHSVWSEGFLWTTLPTLLMVLFRLSWSSVVEAFAGEVPLRGLQRREGSTMQKSVLLDYRRYSAFYSWTVAFWNGHVLLGLCMAFALVNTVVLVPLAAHLFQVVNPNFDREASFLLRTFYNDSRIAASIDYEPILAAVSAVRVHGGNWPLWTDGTYSFPTFAFPENTSTKGNVTQMRLNITAYSADLSCQLVTDYLISRNPVDGNTTTLSISANDRGCDISIKGGVGPGLTVFLKTNSITDCSATSGYSRISFFAGSYSATAPYLLDSMSVISCIPSYNKTQGVVRTPPGFQPLSFERSLGPSPDNRPTNWVGFEQSMLGLSNIGDNNSPDFTSGFGNLMLSLAGTQNLSATLSSETLISSASTVFSSIFAILATTQLFQPLSAPETTSGTLTVSEARLSVVTWSAYISIAILAVLIMLTVSVIIVVPRKPPILPEEPRGILGSASLLYNSNLNQLLADANGSPGYQGQFNKWLKQRYALGTERCEFTAGRRIQVQNLVAKGQQRGGNHYFAL